MGKIHCIICLSPASPMLSLETAIDVEGTSICCGTMYTSVIGIKEDIMDQNSHKLCLACVTQLNTCYLFQQKAIRSAEMLFNIVRNAIIAVDGIPDEETKDNFDEDFCPGEECPDETSENKKNVDYSTNAKWTEYLKNIDSDSLQALVEDSPLAEDYLEEKTEPTRPVSISGRTSPSHSDLNEEYLSDEWEEVQPLSPNTLHKTENSTMTDNGEQNLRESSVAVDKIKVVGAQEQSVRCEKCAEGMDSLASFQKHFLTDHCRVASDERLHCVVCKRSFQSKKTFIQHLRIHQHHRRFVCRVCCKSFHYPHHLRRHEMIHAPERTYSCKKCRMTFNRKDDLIDHKSQHKEAGEYVCERCPGRFKTKKCLLAHKLLKHNEKARFFEPFVCEHCGEMLNSQTAATFHNKRECLTRNKREQLEPNHGSEQLEGNRNPGDNKSATYACDVCGRRFSQSIILKRHKLRHEGVKPYQCHYCERSFLQKGTLTTHIRTHTNERPFPCPRCGESFRSAATRRCHQLRICSG